jgi:uncharacterized protein (DUF2237 family)
MDEALQLNVLGEPLEACGTDPMTGFFRNGYTTTSPQDLGSHTVCAIVTPEFLEHQKAVGNDLSTPMPEYGFAGLKPGDHWAVCAGRWQQSFEAGVAAPVLLRATNEAALDHVPLEALQECAADAPDDLAELLD